ncbi:unnamed protein product [Rotaria socialis]|uniref:Ankyrin and armadillo repeat-containing protein n=2 Tax=Rotaria socialis TaxID=392032 RepID=A0A818MUY6_9BILA|nr:unnamed protein product [Rotaria socialis]
MMISTPIPSPGIVEPIDESLNINVYDDNGYLPLHRAAFNGHELTIKNILDEAQKRNELLQQLEAITHDVNEFTPLLLATAAGRLDIIAYFLTYPVNFYATDAHGFGMTAIAVLSQNERTLRYIIDLPISSKEYNVWKPMFKLFASIREEDSSAAGRMIELLTRPQSDHIHVSSYWLPMLDNGLLPTLVQIFDLSRNDDALESAFLILLNLFNALPDRKSELDKMKNSFSAILKHTRSTNNQILTLLGRTVSSLSTEKLLVDSMVDQGLVESLVTLLDKQHSPQIIYPFFDCLANVVAKSFEYQHKFVFLKDFLLLIVRSYLQEFDLNLSLSVIRFIRQLVRNNPVLQDILAHYGACEHLLGALSASSKELQQVSIEAIQALSDKNQLVQQILLREHALEQLLTLLEKTNMSTLQIAIVCTLWTLCENNSIQKRDVATRIGVRKLISFYTIKSDEHLLVVTDALNELAKSAASVNMNIPEEINQSQGIPYLIRLLKSDNELLVLSVLKSLQLITCAPGFTSNRKNQEIIVKNDGVKLLVALMMHAKREAVQVESAQALACIALGEQLLKYILYKVVILLGNNQCSVLIESTLDFSYGHLVDLMHSRDINVQIKASNALATFIYNNSRVQLSLSNQYQFSFRYFEKFLQSHNDSVRSTAAFQVVAFSGLITEQKQSVNTAIGCGILMDILRASPVDDAQSAAAECLARLAHMKSVSDEHKHTGIPQAVVAVNAIDHLCHLFSSSNDITIGNAAVALGFLSYVPEGRRKLLYRCRNEPDIMAFLKVYNCLPGAIPRLSIHLLEDWDRYDTLKLPKLRSQEANIRYFKVLSNNIERSRAAPQSDYENEQAPSNKSDFYLPPLRQKV